MNRHGYTVTLARTTSLLKGLCLIVAAAAMFTVASPAKADVVFINFMTNQGTAPNENPMDATQFAAVGADVGANVDVQGTTNLPRTWSNVGGVSGGVTYADWWQDGMKAALYDGGNNPDQGFTGGVVAINGTHGGTNPGGFASTATLDLTDYISNNNLTSYQIQIFYAGRQEAGHDALTDANDTIININDGNGLTSDYAQSNLLVVSDPGDSPFFWSGRGAVVSFGSSVTSLTITADSVSGTTQSGIAGIMIIPEPASLALMGLGGLLMLRRRR